MRAVPGTTVCRQHGGESPQALARAQVRLTLAELASTDPRPMAEVLRDAVGSPTSRSATAGRHCALAS